MKFFTKKSNIQKMILSLLIVILVNFAIPHFSYADAWDMGGSLIREIVQLIDALGDSAMGLLNKTMLGTEKMYSSVILEQDDANFQESSSALYADSAGLEKAEEKGTLKKVYAEDLNGLGWGSWKVPNMLYCPENIFANKIPALDVNFLSPNTYTDVNGKQYKWDKDELENEGYITDENGEKIPLSYAAKLQPVISSWYKSFRNIAIVGLLCVLIFLGIRMLIETSAQGKAKYKEMLKDWFLALCLVFAIHFIMSGTLMIIQKVTELLDNSIEDSAIYVQVMKGSEESPTETVQVQFKTNLTGYIRLLAQTEEWATATSYSIIYIAIVIYTFMFTFTYFKRFLYMAFFTMIAPLVALTYPLDKMGDGKAQAFNMWFKEYTMNAILQPLHLLLYTVLVSSAAALAAENPIYALVAIAFLIPAEKFVKKMFKLDKGETAGGAGSFAGGALTMSALQKLGSKKPLIAKAGGNKQASGGDSSLPNNPKIRTEERGMLEAFDGDDTAALAAGAGIGAAVAMNHEGSNINMDDTNNVNVGGNDSVRNMQKQALEEKIADGQIDPNLLTEDQKKLLGYNVPESEKQGNKPNTINTDNLSTKPARKRGRLAAAGRTAIRGAKAIVPNKKFVGKAFGTVGKVGYGLAIGAPMAAAGAAVGVAAGLTTGDPSQVAKFAMTGAGVGGMGAKNVYNTATNIGKVAKDTVPDVVNAYREESYGIEQASQLRIDKQNEKAKKAFMKNDEEKRKYQEMAANISQETHQEYTPKQLMEAAFDYQKAGITDEAQIEKGLTLEAKYGGVGAQNHKKMMDVMKFTQTYGKEHVTDEKKRTAVEDVVRSKITGEQNQKDVMKLWSEANGLGKYYKDHGKIV